jgi:hypothetical protein
MKAIDPANLTRASTRKTQWQKYKKKAMQQLSVCAAFVYPRLFHSCRDTALVCYRRRQSDGLATSVRDLEIGETKFPKWIRPQPLLT